MATVTLVDGNVITITGTSGGDKHWIQVQSSKDAALNAKAQGPRIRNRRLPLRRDIPAAGTIAGAEGPPPAAKTPAAERCRRPAAARIAGASPAKKPAPAPRP